ncbi:MAG: hypothetical protein JNK11_02555, partial [Alphaproteobacteria bacterium]|nr:hypothetical protein [Alphaproteobacteria bacterium]
MRTLAMTKARLAFWAASSAYIAAAAFAPRSWAVLVAALLVAAGLWRHFRALGSRNENWPGSVLTVILVIASGLALRVAVGHPVRPLAAFNSIGQILYLVGLPGVTAGGLLVAAIAGPVVRAQVLITGGLCAACLLGFDAWLAWPRPVQGKAAERYTIVKAMAERRSEAFDGRFDHEVIADLRRQGIDAFPLLSPTSFLLEPRTMQPRLPLRGFTAKDGRSFLPLAGIPDARTVYCNETGQWLIYDADELGFANPKGAWSRPTVDIALVGD